MHCHQPLLAFISKMRPSETSLGPSRSAGTLVTIERRLHWSLITRNDVDELRKVSIIFIHSQVNVPYPECCRIQ